MTKRRSFFEKILILALVLALAAVVFTSCAKEAPKQQSYTVYNRSGEAITELRVSNKSGSSATTCRNVGDGAYIKAEVMLTSGEDVSVTVTLAGITATFPVPQDNHTVTITAGPNITYAPPQE